MVTIDFRKIAQDAYDVICSEHGSLVERQPMTLAAFRALEHDAKEHGKGGEWLYGGLSILDSFGEPSPTESPAARVVDVRRKRREMELQEGLL